MISFVAHGYESDRLRFAFAAGALSATYKVHQSNVGEGEALGGDWYGAEEKALPDILKEAESCAVTLLRDLED